jgi:hypothetical protein
MTKEITIGGKIYKFRSTAAIPRMYRLRFNRDIFVDMEKLAENIEASEKKQEVERMTAESEGIAYKESSSLPIDSLEMFENIAYLMNRHGDPTQPEDIDTWLEQFDTFNIYEILPEILELWNLNNKGLSVSKKKDAR